MTQQNLDREGNDSTGPSREPATTLTLRLLILGLLLTGCFLVIRPFLSSLMWATVLCISSWPVYSRLVGLLRGRRTLAAAILTLGILLFLLAPFILIGISLADNVKDFGVGARHLLESPPLEPPGWVEKLPLVGSKAGVAWRELASNSAMLITRLKRFVEPVTAGLLAGSVQFLSGVAELGLSIFIAFFFFRDGGAIALRFVNVTEQIAGTQARELVDVAGRTIRGVVYGVLGTALAQAVVAGIGFVIAGIPGAGLLTLLTFFLSVVPMGPPLVWIPAAVWLFWKGSIGWGVFMVCWGLLVSSLDNVIKPMIISRGGRMPFILVLLGVLGGAITFGFIGVFLGPTLLVVGLRLLECWNTMRLPQAGSLTEAR